MSQVTLYRGLEPFSGLRRINQLVDQVLGDAGMLGPGADTGSVTSAWIPVVDVTESAEKVRIVAELPGVKAEDVKIALEQNVLTLRGEKRQEKESKSEQFHRLERSYGMFERRFVLPSTVDADRIQAKYDGGVLTIELPKVERAKPREIRITAG